MPGLLDGASSKAKRLWGGGIKTAGHTTLCACAVCGSGGSQAKASPLQLVGPSPLLALMLSSIFGTLKAGMMPCPCEASQPLD